MNDKLKILEETGEIDSDTKEFILSVKDYLSSKGLTSEEDDPAEPFLTHLAMANMRVKKGEKIEQLNTTILEEIFSTNHFPKAKMLWEDMLKLSNNEFDESEQGYIFMHIVNMLGNHQD